jgi:sugar phosphate permease
MFECSPSALNIHPGLGKFVITAGALHGICSGLLWAAQGSLMMSYPTEGQKGRFVAIFWTIFNLGGVVGASVTLGQNFHSTVCYISPLSLDNSLTTFAGQLW